MNYQLVFAPRALKDLETIKRSGDKSHLKKVAVILKELVDHPLTGTGNPEKLRYLDNCYSRRISQKDRIVYSINDDIVQVDILQMLGPYNDK